MTLTELLKHEDYDARITVGHRWLVCEGEMYCVYEKKPYKKATSIIAETRDEQEAVKELMEG